MKRRAIIFSLLVVTLFGGIFYVQTFSRVEHVRLNFFADLSYRSDILSQQIIEKISEKESDISFIGQILEKIAQYAKVIDIAYYDRTGALAAYKKNPLFEGTGHVPSVEENMLQQETLPVAEFAKGYARFLYPVSNERGEIFGYLLFTQDTTYIDEHIRGTWRDRSIIFFSLIIGLFAFAYFLFYVYVMRSSSVAVALLRDVRKSVDHSGEIPRNVFPFSPELNSEIALTVQSFLRARQGAREEADLRYKIIDSPWTFSRLQRFFANRMPERKLINVSNRQPYVHTESGGKTVVVQPAHGLIASLDEMMKACGGTWIAHGAGSRDKDAVDHDDKIAVPPDEPKYFLKRVWLSEDEVRGHYVGFSNEALYPLCLMTHNRPIFRTDDWNAYKAVNEKFASAVIAEIADERDPIIFIHDLHFALLPQLIKKERPDAGVILFWHHPWPSAEQFSILPWKKEVLTGLLSADVLCFHVHHFCNNFTETVKKELEAKIDTENSAVSLDGKETLVKHFPISIPFTNLHSDTPHDQKRVDRIAGEDLGGLRVILGVDRMDYTKGLIERLKGVELFYETYPEFKKTSVFVQVAAPSREAVLKYRQYAEQVLAEVDRINKKLQTNTWKPIIFLHKQVPQRDLVHLYRKAEICLVTSLHDGMNLVAKEYVAQHTDEGVLILSEFTGAARELHTAIKINPYSTSDIVEAIHSAFLMEGHERRTRLDAMRSKIAQYNVFRWAADIFDAFLNK